MTQSKKPKIRNRYSIGEWYGAGFELLTPAERCTRAKTDCDANAILSTVCPFQKDAKCKKKGGVCSLRQYQQVSGVPMSGTGPVIATCPQRFLESDTIFRWVGETLLQTSEPVVLSVAIFCAVSSGRLLDASSGVNKIDQLVSGGRGVRVADRAAARRREQDN